jgi:hypothetical protein
MPFMVGEAGEAAMLGNSRESLRLGAKRRKEKTPGRRNCLFFPGGYWANNKDRAKTKT